MTGVFGAMAEECERGRPGWPADAIAGLLEPHRRAVGGSRRADVPWREILERDGRFEPLRDETVGHEQQHTRHGERVPRAGMRVEPVNEHGQAVPCVPVRLALHVSPHRLALQPPLLRSARGRRTIRSSSARSGAARLLHGRENERLEALRDGALPTARIAVRAARAAARRRAP